MLLSTICPYVRFFGRAMTFEINIKSVQMFIYKPKISTLRGFAQQWYNNGWKILKNHVDRNNLKALNRRMEDGKPWIFMTFKYNCLKRFLYCVPILSHDFLDFQKGKGEMMTYWLDGRTGPSPVRPTSTSLDYTPSFLARIHSQGRTSPRYRPASELKNPQY